MVTKKQKSPHVGRVESNVPIGRFQKANSEFLIIEIEIVNLNENKHEIMSLS